MSERQQLLRRLSFVVPHDDFIVVQREFTDATELREQVERLTQERDTLREANHEMAKAAITAKHTHDTTMRVLRFSMELDTHVLKYAHSVEEALQHTANRMVRTLANDPRLAGAKADV